MADEAKKYLDYEGLKHLVEKLTDRIEASGGGSGGGTAQGVYVAYVDTGGVNRICKPSDWSADMGTPSGAVIVAGGRNLLVGPNYIDVEDNFSTAFQFPADGVVCTFAEELQARGDFAGRESTKSLSEKGGMETAVSFCLSCSYGAAGEGKWWLPSLGEAVLVAANIDGVTEAFGAMGLKTQALSQNIITDTRQSSLYMWALDLPSGKALLMEEYDDADYSCYILPVSEWVWVEAAGGAGRCILRTTR